MTSHEALLDIEQAARFLNVSETSLRRWTNSGRLPCLRVGRKRERRFRRADLLAFLEDQPLGREAEPPRPADASARQALIDGIAVPHGTHLCGLYATDEGRSKLAASFLAGGLRPRSACLLFATPQAQKGVLQQLKRRHPTVAADVKSGRLVLAEYRCSPDEQYDLFNTHLEAAIRAGARSVRIVGDVWGLARHITADELIAYETGLEKTVLERFPIVVLCTYDVRLFSGLEIVNACKAHPDCWRYPREWLLA
jgi:excisionase family DNA binding protein